ncbi:uncharacterized protein LOC124887032 [Capsicum annuum]|uniref:uncharacterized protein LOC124887032 n=1 Tax=Capsicum annuum TaxID=4072 RepID=UPI001FB08C3D|nr:uncharacterized protein LOC124887032 [Capsicum annuum]
MRKVIAVDDTHLHGKYEGVLLSAVAQDTKNYTYPIDFCIIDKENYMSWMFFLEKLKSIVVDGPDLCFISNRHKSIANDIARDYNHTHHGYFMRNLEFSNNFEEFKNYCPETAFFLEHNRGFERWSRVHFLENRYDVMTTNIAESINSMLIAKREYPVASMFNSISKRFGEIFRERRAYVLNYKDIKFVPVAEKIVKDNMCEGYSFYVKNVNGDDNQFTVFGRGLTTKVNLLEKLCSCRKFDLVKIP